MIREVSPFDAGQICEIYNYYILNSTVTFEELPASSEVIRERIETCISKWPWLVYEAGDRILGYAYAIDWKPRDAYKHSVESSVYLRQGEEGKGVGSSLYTDLLERLSNLNVHAVIGGITLPNDKSIAFHEKFGFSKVAQFEEVGYKFGEWLDVGYWELLLGKK
ncbi:MAG: N-acetyltransferase [Flavobacteriales bacterium]|nr:N-acetyltransferase [Flavobacteriales bacterium]